MVSEKDRGHVSKVRRLCEPRQGYDRLPLGEFFNLGTFDVFAWVILCWGLGEGSPLYCRVFSSKPGLYPLDVHLPSPPLPPTHTHTHTHVLWYVQIASTTPLVLWGRY